MDEIFLSKNGSTNNNVKDEPIDEYECDLCDFKTQEDIELINHLQTEHSEQVEVKREIDEGENVVQTSEDFNFDTKNYKEIKNEIDNQKLPLLQSERVKYFNCEYCGKSFEHKFLLDKHVLRDKNCGILVSKQKAIKLEEQPEKQIKKEQPIYECDRCDKTYESLTEIQRHTSSAEYKNKYLAKCKDLHDKNCSFTSCTLAGLEFHNELVHKNSQTDPKLVHLKTIKCDICNFGPCSERIIQIHKINNHSNKILKRLNSAEKTKPIPISGNELKEDEFRFQCTICNAKYLWQSTLEDHIKKVHQNSDASNNIVKLTMNSMNTNGLQFGNCDRCLKVYNGKDDKMTHINSQEYINGTIAKCSLNYSPSCPFLSCTALGLQIHIQNVHKKLHESSSIKSSSNNFLYKSRKNDDNNCEFCDMEIDDKEELMKHQKLRLYSKPLSCQFCLYKSCDKSNMMLHKQLLMSCDFCQFKSCKYVDMKIHQRENHHQKENKNEGDEIQIVPMSSADSDSQNINGNNQSVNKKIRQNIKCEKCSTVFDSLDEKSNHDSNRFDYKIGTKFSCAFCFFVSCTVGDLERHHKISHPKIQYPAKMVDEKMQESFRSLNSIPCRGGLITKNSNTNNKQLTNVNTNSNAESTTTTENEESISKLDDNEIKPNLDQLKSNSVYFNPSTNPFSLFSSSSMPSKEPTSEKSIISDVPLPDPIVVSVSKSLQSSKVTVTNANVSKTNKSIPISHYRQNGLLEVKPVVVKEEEKFVSAEPLPYFKSENQSIITTDPLAFVSVSENLDTSNNTEASAVSYQEESKSNDSIESMDTSETDTSVTIKQEEEQQQNTNSANLTQDMVYGINVNKSSRLQYKCGKCEKTYLSELKLQSHNRKNHGGNDLNCSDCDARFESLTLKNRHEKNEEFNARQPKACYKCNFVSCTFDDLVQHLTVVHKSVSDLVKNFPERFCKKIEKVTNTSNTSIIKCDKCDRHFSNLNQYKKHQLHMNRQSVPQILKQCNMPKCPMKFCTSEGLIIHLKKRHGALETASLIQKLRKDEISENLNNDDFQKRMVQMSKCDKCDCKFISAEDKQVHQRSKGYQTHDNLKFCSKCQFKFCTIDSLVTHSVEIHKSLLSCEKCDAKFTNYGERTLHLESDQFQKEGMKYCPGCQFKSCTDDFLQDHLKKFPNHRGIGKIAKIVPSNSGPQIKQYVDQIITLRSSRQNLIVLPSSQQNLNQSTSLNFQSQNTTNIPDLISNQDGSNLMYKCNRCDIEFSKLTELELHKSSMEYKTPLKVCSCQFKSCTLDAMKIHFKMKHSSVVEKQNPMKIDNQQTQHSQARNFVGEQNLKENQYRYKCNYCGLGFERVLDKLRHQKNVHMN